MSSSRKSSLPEWPPYDSWKNIAEHYQVRNITDASIVQFKLKFGFMPRDSFGDDPAMTPGAITLLNRLMEYSNRIAGGWNDAAIAQCSVVVAAIIDFMENTPPPVRKTREPQAPAGPPARAAVAVVRRSTREPIPFESLMLSWVDYWPVNPEIDSIRPKQYLWFVTQLFGEDGQHLFKDDFYRFQYIVDQLCGILPSEFEFVYNNLPPDMKQIVYLFDVLLEKYKALAELVCGHENSSTEIVEANELRKLLAGPYKLLKKLVPILIEHAPEPEPRATITSAPATAVRKPVTRPTALAQASVGAVQAWRR